MELYQNQINYSKNGNDERKLKLKELYKKSEDNLPYGQNKSEFIKLISFKIEHEEFVIEIHKIKEVCKIPLVTRVSKAPYFVEGVANLRGDLLQIVNIHKILHLKNIPLSEQSRIIVLDDKNIHAAIIVDVVGEVMEVEKDAIQVTPDFFVKNKGNFFKGIIKPHKNRNVIWLNVSAMYEEFISHHEKKE
ncbi:MAG: chemotaxis protein CheW [Silvanigrellaceae bacterium]|nr:chemotaxis protein CheW [Silvanigrellaceae bacterium]